MNEKRGAPIQGRLLNLKARSVGSRIWLGPGWALLCGAVASAGLDISWHTVISLLVGLLLVDSLLGTVWSLVADRGAVLVSGGEGNPGEKTNLAAPPYTLPGSFGYRLFSFLGERASAWRSALSSSVGSPLLTLAFNSLFALVLGALLGEGPLLLTVVALLVTVSLLALSPSQEAMRLALGSFFLAGLAWLMGYAIFHNLAAPSSDASLMVKPLLWAAIYALVFHGYQLISRESLTRGATLLDFAQLAGIALLIIVKQPILAGVAGLLLLPQLLLQPALLSVGDGLWYLRSVQAFTMAAMMVTAVAAAM